MTAHNFVVISSHHKTNHCNIIMKVILFRTREFILCTIDFTQDWQHIQMIHVFQDQLITGQESLQCGFKINAQMEPIVDLQNMKTFEEHFYLVVIEKLINGTSVLHMWRIIISSHGVYRVAISTHFWVYYAF